MPKYSVGLISYFPKIALLFLLMVVFGMVMSVEISDRVRTRITGRERLPRIGCEI
jgi:hypothetical protein